MAKNEIIITRTFNASRELVWKAWTDPELMMRWWGPKAFSAPDAKMDVRVGGKYHLSMQGPDRPKFWSTGMYLEIVPMKKLVVTDSFSDEEGNIVDPTKFGMSPDFPMETEVTILFEDEGNGTKLTIRYAPQSDVVYEAMVKSGMDHGWNESLDKLAESLK